MFQGSILSPAHGPWWSRSNGVPGKLGTFAFIFLDPLTIGVGFRILCSWSGRNGAALKQKDQTMNIPGPMVCVGTDEEGFAVYLFCGPMQPVKSFRIPAQVSK